VHLCEQAETCTAQAFEEFVSKPSFDVVLARSADNVEAIGRISSDSADSDCGIVHGRPLAVVFLA
jgi:hypothetical protein